MRKKHRMKYFPIRLLVLFFCLSTLLTNSDLSARASQKNHLGPSPQVLPQDVTVEIIDLETYQAEAIEQPMDASWVHGNGITLENPRGGRQRLTINHFGWGTDITIPPNEGGWIHFAIPTPVLTQSARAKLVCVLLAFDTEFEGGGGAVDQIDVWDGAFRILAMPLNPPLTGDHFRLERLVRLHFSEPPYMLFGLGLSVHVVNNTNSTRTLRIISAGADFTR